VWNPRNITGFVLSIDAINHLFFVFHRRRLVSNNDAVVFDVFFLTSLFVFLRCPEVSLGSLCSVGRPTARCPEVGLDFWFLRCPEVELEIWGRKRAKAGPVRRRQKVKIMKKNTRRFFSLFARLGDAENVQKLDWTSGGEVSRGRFRILCVYDFRIPHQVLKALGRSRRKSYCKGGVSRGREERPRRKVCSIREREPDNFIKSALRVIRLQRKSCFNMLVKKV
jgi:hypothetical protein